MWSRLTSPRGLVTWCLAGTTTFVVTYAIAIALYPGGTWWARGAKGHSFTYNFLCDLMQTVALNGEPAPIGSALARVGMFAMLLALASFYTQIARLEAAPSRASKAARIAGWMACAFGCTVPVITSDVWRLGHLISVVAAFAPSLVAVTASLLICMRTAGVSWWMRVPALVTLGAGALDGFAYLYVYTAPTLGLVPKSFEVRMMVNTSLPLLQRVATFGVLTWVVATCAHTWRRASGGQG